MWKPSTILILVVLLAIPSIFGLDECKGTLTTEEVPCFVLLPSSTDCTTKTVTYYNESTQLHTQVLGVYSPFLCNSTFNYTTPSTYTFNFSTGDSGSIIVTEDENMILSIIIGLGIYAAILLFIAYKLEESHFIMKLLMTIMAITSTILIPVTYITGNTSIIFHKLSIGFFVLFWLYVIIYFTWWIFQKTARTVPQ